MANINNDPNARYDHGANAAGCGKTTNQSTLQAAATPGLTSAGLLNDGVVRTGLNAAGVDKNNPGPNVAGAKRSYGGT